MTDLYVYYRVLPARQGEARDAARLMLAAVERASGIAGRLQQRADDALTWMEIYPSIDDVASFSAALDAALQAAGLHACIDGERHTERFVPCV
ncbi:DUF4936 family protein [Denitromonas sp.]|uniref:DUF4936 family protein n=1 Tax=Denitromonas sp. TaxID=2734609 RepID=UPI003A8A8267